MTKERVLVEVFDGKIVLAELKYNTDGREYIAKLGEPPIFIYKYIKYYGSIDEVLKDI